VGRFKKTPLLSDQIEFTTVFKTCEPRKSLWFTRSHDLFFRSGYGKLAPAAGATTVNHLTPILGQHPLPEAMGSFTTNTTGLVCSFAHYAGSSRVIDSSGEIQ
jgi:hypothetical protein